MDGMFYLFTVHHWEGSMLGPVSIQDLLYSSCFKVSSQAKIHNLFFLCPAYLYLCMYMYSQESAICLLSICHQLLSDSVTRAGHQFVTHSLNKFDNEKNKQAPVV